MRTIDQLIETYAELERRVRALMTQLFSGTCGMCTACCCRADICEEATESAFLSKLLEKQGLKKADMDDSYGWLDLHGCSLQYGRPPVCYEFYCDELLARLPDAETRYSAKVLGKLISHVGRDALGGWHLVEIMEDEDLEKIDHGSIHKKLEESSAAFEIIQEYVSTGRLTKSDREALDLITGDED